MLNTLPAPAFIFKPFDPIRSNALNTSNNTDAKDSIDEQSPNGDLLRLKPSLTSATYQIAGVKSSLGFFESFRQEQLAGSIVNQLINKPENQISLFEKNYRIDLNIDYRANLIENLKNPEDTGGENGRAVVSRKMTVNNYRAGYMVQSHFREREQQVGLFFRQSEKFVSEIKSVRAGNYLSVRNKVAASFRYNLSLDFSFLAQFNDQARALDQGTNNELKGYLNTTDKLLDTSAELTKSFFDTVDSYLESAKDTLVERIETFFHDLRHAMGRKMEKSESDRELILERIDTFFGKVLSMLDKAEDEIIDRIDTGKTMTMEKERIDNKSASENTEGPVENPVRLNALRQETTRNIPNGLPLDNHELLNLKKTSVDKVV